MVFHLICTLTNEHGCTSVVIAVWSGCVAVLSSSPLWVANTRLKLQGVNVKFGADRQYITAGQLPTYSGIVGV